MMTVPQRLTGYYGILGIGNCDAYREYDGKYKMRLYYSVNRNPHCYNNLMSCCKKHLSVDEYNNLYTVYTVRTTLQCWSTILKEYYSKYNIVDIDKPKTFKKSDSPSILILKLASNTDNYISVVVDKDLLYTRPYYIGELSKRGCPVSIAIRILSTILKPGYNQFNSNLYYWVTRKSKHLNIGCKTFNLKQMKNLKDYLSIQIGKTPIVKKKSKRTKIILLK